MRIPGLVTTQLPEGISLHWSLLNRPLQDTIYAYFRRGFAETIRCTAANWLIHGDAIRRENPVTRVRLTTMPSRSEMHEVCRHLAVDEQFGRWGNTQKVMLGIRWPGVEFELPPRGLWPVGAQGPLAVSMGGKAPIAEGDIVELVPTEFWTVQRYQSGTAFGVAQHGIERDGPIRVMQQGEF